MKPESSPTEHYEILLRAGMLASFRLGFLEPVAEAFRLVLDERLDEVPEPMRNRLLPFMERCEAIYVENNGDLAQLHAAIRGAGSAIGYRKGFGPAPNARLISVLGKDAFETEVFRAILEEGRDVDFFTVDRCLASALEVIAKLSAGGALFWAELRRIGAVSTENEEKREPNDKECKMQEKAEASHGKKPSATLSGPPKSKTAAKPEPKEQKPETKAPPAKSKAAPPKEKQQDWLAILGAAAAAIVATAVAMDQRNKKREKSREEELRRREAEWDRKEAEWDRKFKALECQSRQQARKPGSPMTELAIDAVLDRISRSRRAA